VLPIGNGPAIQAQGIEVDGFSRVSRRSLWLITGSSALSDSIRNGPNMLLA
jgi:hypothetical protein